MSSSHSILNDDGGCACEGTLFIVSAPSGAGKTSLVNALVACDPQVELSVSHTTRAIRPGEMDGRHYHFVDRARFSQLRYEGLFLEWAQVFGNSYGTSSRAVSGRLALGRDVILEIDWQGARQVREAMPGVVSIFVLPPSPGALRERLAGRGQDSPEVIEGRMAAASRELSHWQEFDYLVVNDEFQAAVEQLHAIVVASRLVVARQAARHRDLLARFAATDAP